MYKIRLAEDTDEETLLEMGRKFYTTTEMSKLIPFDEDAASAQLFNMLDQGFVLLAETEDATPIGMMGCVFSDFLYNRDFTMCTEMMFWLNEEHRGSTLAVHMIKEAELLAIHEGASFISLSALETSPDGIDTFYKRLSYNRSERTYIKGI